MTDLAYVLVGWIGSATVIAGYAIRLRVRLHRSRPHHERGAL